MTNEYTRERAWAALHDVSTSADIDTRARRSHYLHCRAGGMGHLKAYLRCYRGIDQHSWLYEIPWIIGWLLLLAVLTFPLWACLL